MAVGDHVYQAIETAKQLWREFRLLGEGDDIDKPMGRAGSVEISETYEVNHCLRDVNEGRGEQSSNGAGTVQIPGNPSTSRGVEHADPDSEASSEARPSSSGAKVNPLIVGDETFGGLPHRGVGAAQLPKFGALMGDAGPSQAESSSKSFGRPAAFGRIVSRRKIKTQRPRPEASLGDADVAQLPKFGALLGDAGLSQAESSSKSFGKPAAFGRIVSRRKIKTQRPGSEASLGDADVAQLPKFGALVGDAGLSQAKSSSKSFGQPAVFGGIVSRRKIKTQRPGPEVSPRGAGAAQLRLRTLLGGTRAAHGREAPHRGTGADQLRLRTLPGGTSATHGREGLHRGAGAAQLRLRTLSGGTRVAHPPVPEAPHRGTGAAQLRLRALPGGIRAAHPPVPEAPRRRTGAAQLLRLRTLSGGTSAAHGREGLHRGAGAVQLRLRTLSGGTRAAHGREGLHRGAGAAQLLRLRTLSGGC